MVDFMRKNIEINAITIHLAKVLLKSIALVLNIVGIVLRLKNILLNLRVKHKIKTEFMLERLY